MTSMSATEPTGPGRNRITSRALNRVASAVTAEELGVETRKVGVDLEGEGRALTLTVRAPIHVPSLERVIANSASLARTGGTVMDRAAKAQENIRTRVIELTGSDISRIVLRLTGADIRPEKRVK